MNRPLSDEPARLLLVDDVPENLVALEAIVRTDHVEVLTATSGTEALDRLLDIDVALALIDVQMPGMNGFELAELMRGTARTRDIPILFVTAGREASYAFRGYESGAVDVLFKPLDPFIVRNKVRVFLQLDRQRRSLARALREAESASRMKDEFLATLSHELRTPLAAILGWADLLDALEPGSPEFAQGLETVQRNARLQAEMINDLLDASRSINGRLAVDLRPTDLVAVVRGAVESCRVAANARSLELHADLGDGGVQVQGDPARLQQVVTNLLGNATKFTPPGGRLSVTLRREGDEAVLEVTDTGEGIAPEFLPHLFDRFSQQRGMGSRRHGGLGLGLSIARNLVELHGGQIAAHSDGPGRGATFTVRLPAPATTADAGHEARPAPRAARGGRLAGLTVALVEDSDDMRHLVASVLERQGALVVAHASATGALQALARQPADVLVSDIAMPEMDGLELVRRLRGARLDRTPAGARLPAAALSAYARDVDVERALAAGFDVHLAKPVSPERLTSTVAELAGRS